MSMEAQPDMMTMKSNGMSKRAAAAAKLASDEFDVIILGAGIAGTLIAAILARHEYKVLLVDSETHPRFAVGESTVGRTSTTLSTISARYDVPEIKALATFRGIYENVSVNCGVKRGVGFLFHREGEQRAEESNQFVIPSILHGPENHLFRQDTDAYMLNVAAKYGATVRQATKIKDVDVSETGVKIKDERGQEYRGRYIVDCAGFRSPLAMKLGLRENPTRCKHHARSLFTHMIGVRHYDELIPKNFHEMPLPWHQTTLHHIVDGAWIWVIPFNNYPGAKNPLCSVGLTLDERKHPKPSCSPEEEWKKFIAPYPTIAAQFAEANTVRPWVSTDRIQYSATRAVGPRYCLLGHSYGFIDPLFSRGLAITMDVVQSLPARLMRALDDDDFSMDRFEFIDRLTAGLLSSNDDLVNCAYNAFSHYDLFNAWIRIWAVGEVGLDQLRILRAQLDFNDTKDQKFLEALDDVPFPGMLSPTHEEFQNVWKTSIAEIEGVAAGTEKAPEIAERVFKRVQDLAVIAPYFRLYDPKMRYVPGDIVSCARAFAWGKMSSSEMIRKRYYSFKNTQLAKLGWKHARDVWRWG